MIASKLLIAVGVCFLVVVALRRARRNPRPGATGSDTGWVDSGGTSTTDCSEAGADGSCDAGGGDGGGGDGGGGSD